MVPKREGVGDRFCPCVSSEDGICYLLCRRSVRSCLERPARMQGLLSALWSIGKAGWDLVGFVIEWKWMSLLLFGAVPGGYLFVRWMDRDLRYD